MAHYTHRIAMVVPVDEAARASGAAAQLSGNPHDRDGFFSVRLSPTGDEPVTHLGASSALRNRNVNSLPALKQQFPGGDYEVGEDANVNARNQFDTLLARMGLREIEVQI